MKYAILPCALFAFLLMGSTAWAEKCSVELNGGLREWKGPCKDGEAYGTGVADFPKLTYEGPARGGRAHGRAKLRFKKGGYAVGNFHHGAAHGQFEGEDAEGNRIVGEFRLAEDGNRYLMYSIDDRQFDQKSAAQGPAPVREEPVARACYLEANGELLDWSGPCKDGKAEGNGTATAADGMTYTGSAQDGKPHGQGTLISASGQMLYQGGYKKGVPHGRGTFLGPDGRYYVSYFDHGEQVGERIPVHGFASDESSPESAGETEAGVEEAALPDADEDGDLKDYDRELTELEEHERQLEIEARFAEKQREAELRSEPHKAELREKAAAIEEKKVRRDQAHAAALKASGIFEDDQEAREKAKRKLKAGIEKNRRMAELVQTHNRRLSRCNNIKVKRGLCWDPKRKRRGGGDGGGGTSRALAKCEREWQRKAKANRESCVERARSIYQSELRSLLLSNP